MKDAFREFSDATAATPQSVERVMRRCLQNREEAQTSRRLFRWLPGAPRGAEARVLARLREGSTARQRRLPTLLIAALVLLAVGVGSRHWNRAAPVAADLQGTAWTELPATDTVKLHYLGEGTLAGTLGAPRIEWRQGTLQVEVTPDRGIALIVETPEGEIAVVGTAFEVTRDLLGTVVRVSHGAVAVRCANGGSGAVAAGGSFTCPPTSAAGLLARARALGAAPGEDAAVLEAAAQGLALNPDEAIGAELRLVRAQALSALSRHEEAFAAASEALATGAGARRLDLLHLAAQAGWRSAGCPSALPHLRALNAIDDARAIELVMLADCVAADSPPEARSSLERALQLGVPADQEPAVRARLDELDEPRR